MSTIEKKIEKLYKFATTLSGRHDDINSTESSTQGPPLNARIHIFYLACLCLLALSFAIFTKFYSRHLGQNPEVDSIVGNSKQQLNDLRDTVKKNNANQGSNGELLRATEQKLNEIEVDLEKIKLEKFKLYSLHFSTNQKLVAANKKIVNLEKKISQLETTVQNIKKSNSTKSKYVPPKPIQVKPLPSIPVQPKPIIVNPKQVSKPRPIMPTRAEKSGSCKVQYYINQYGTTYSVRAFDCTESLFKNASEKAVQKWQFEPKIVDGDPHVSGPFESTISFRLTDERGKIIPE